MSEASEEEKKKQKCLHEKQAKLQDLHKEVMLFRGELSELEKTMSRLNNESITLHNEIEDMMDG